TNVVIERFPEGGGSRFFVILRSVFCDDRAASPKGEELGVAFDFAQLRDPSHSLGMTIPEGAFCPIASPKGKELGVDSEDPKTRSFTSFRMTNLLSSRGGASPEGRI
ncbi:MAG TPA: hypothetical protein P5219_09000, partial [Aminivibrio sp.]|nr:hypothetical protein [Aminivibrio sp.]